MSNRTLIRAAIFSIVFGLLSCAIWFVPQSVNGVGNGQGVVRRIKTAGGGGGGGGGGGVLFLNDTFTDTDFVALTAHTPEIGSAWAIGYNGGGASNYIRNNRYEADSGQVMAYNTVTTPNDSVVTCTIDYLNTSFTRAWCMGRMDTSANSGYGIEIDENVPQVALRKAVTGTYTTIGIADTSWTPTFNDQLITELTMTGTTISGRYKINGGGWISLGSATDATFASGKVGAYYRNSGNSISGLKFTSITAQSITASDNFDRADSFSLGANWTVQVTAYGAQIINNQTSGQSGGAGYVFWSGAGTFTDNQYSQITVVTPVTAQPSNAGVRMSGAGVGLVNVKGYFCGNTRDAGISDDRYKIWKENFDNNPTLIGSVTGGQLVTSGDIIKLGVTFSSGVNTLTCSRNGVDLPGLTSITDTTIGTGGKPGFIVPDTARADNWSGGAFP